MSVVSAAGTIGRRAQSPADQLSDDSVHVARSRSNSNELCLNNERSRQLSLDTLLSSPMVHVRAAENTVSVPSNRLYFKCTEV